tara:strand:- start:476 stop:808 length:333 start_codon:yes stop_codon:yes gene_type:complete
MKNLVMTIAVATTMLFATQGISAQEDTDSAMMTKDNSEIVAQDTYNEIDTATLPEAVTAAVETDYAGASITEAYKNENDIYKLVLETEAGAEAETVYANAKGEWVEPDEI